MSDRYLRKTSDLHRLAAIRIALFYIVLAAAWIFLSDRVLDWLVNEPGTLTRIQTYKGWAFVCVTGGGLYLYLRRCLKRLQDSLAQVEHERRQGESNMKEQFRQFATIFDALNAVVYVADIETHELLFVNQNTAAQFGRDWAGKTCYQYLQQGQDTPCEFCTNAQLTVDGKPGPTVCWEFMNTSNNRWYECFDKALYWTDGRLVRLEIAMDITERKRLEKAKNDMLSSVSHEMRTPLTAITGFTELLLDKPDVPTEIRRQLQIIFDQAEKLGDLIDLFIDVRRLKTDRARVDYETLPVTTLLENGSRSCRDCTPGHQIEIDSPDGLSVFGNNKELTGVIAQLVSNACRYSPGGGKIELSAGEDHDFVRIYVKDHGIGIPMDQQEQIFERFFRLDSGDQRRTGGTGLGLALVKEVVELHGGKITVSSKPDEGSSFRLLLPKAAPSRPAQVAS